MYGSLKTAKEFENGQHLWYETCFGNGKFILVVDKQADYNVRTLKAKSLAKTDYIIKQIVDPEEVFPISEETHPEKYVYEGVRV